MTQPTPPRLPVPELDGTLERFLQQVRPLLSDEDYTEAETAARAFQQDTAPALQAALQRRAERLHDHSWLIDTWLDGYLRIREPLPLASNVGFQIQMQGADLAQWAAALAVVCADYRHGRVETPVSPQGNPVCMNQWWIVQGAARIPQAACDDYRFADNSSTIGVLYRGWYYRLPAFDKADEALPVCVFRSQLEQILAENDDNPYPLGVAACVGGDDGAALYAKLRRQPANAVLLDDLEADLFHISLDDHSLNADEDLAYAAFAPDCGIWFYKPMTFRYNTATGRLYLHCEHTWEDGGTLKAVVARAADKLGSLPEKNFLEKPDAPQRFGWHLDDSLKAQWPQWQQHYAARAAAMRVVSTTVPFEGAVIPKGISQDALMQFVLQYAQLATYGQVRNTYEAVDVSHFQCGRTECVRPVSQESLAFVRGLLAGSPDRVALDAALAEHKARVKAAKMGLGANRHLLGLHTEAKDEGIDCAWFDSPAYRVFTTDFLSTSTLGDDALVVNFAFAPTSAGGLGINYTLTADGWLFTVSYQAKQQDEVERFIAAVQRGGRALLDYVCA